MGTPTAARTIIPARRTGTSTSRTRCSRSCPRSRRACRVRTSRGEGDLVYAAGSKPGGSHDQDSRGIRWLKSRDSDFAVYAGWAGRAVPICRESHTPFILKQATNRTADVSWLCFSNGLCICPEHRLLCSVSLVRMIVCQYSDRAPAQRTENAALQLGGLPHLRVREARKRTGKDARWNPPVCRWPPGCRFELVCGTCGGHKFHARSFSRSGNPAIVAVKAIR